MLPYAFAGAAAEAMLSFGFGLLLGLLLLSRCLLLPEASGQT